MDQQVIGSLAALGSAASWALGAILFKQLGEHLPPAAMTLAKGVISTLLLGCVLTWIGYEAVDQKTLGLLIGSGLLGIALGDTFFFAALRNLSAYVVVVFFMLGQVLTALFAILWFGEIVAPPAIVGIVLTIFGITLVLWSQCWDEKDPGASNVTGIFYGLLSMLCMSGSVLIAKQALNVTPTIQATFIRMLAGMLGVMIFSLFTRQTLGFIKPFANVKFSLQFLVSVGIVTFGGFWLSMVGIKYLDVAIANTLNSTEPLFALPLAVIFLKERVTPLIILGCLISICGVILLTGGWVPKGLLI
ncbi:MAG: DMT family transporter [Methylococcales bacterium]